MGDKGYGRILGTLSECVTCLAMPLPVRSAPTFIELLNGAMLTRAGFAPEAWLASTPCEAEVPIIKGSRRASGPGSPLG